MRKFLLLVLSLFCSLSYANTDSINILNMVMLFDENITQQAEDLKKMSADKVADIHLISFFLVPEGNPPVDKFSQFADKYRRLKDSLGNADCKLGIIFQATLGHGFPLENPHPFQCVVPFTNSKFRENAGKNIVCPLDKNFQKYITNCFRRAVALKPEVLMVDDDFRLVGYRDGCVCPLHLARLKQDFGYDLTREELLKHLSGNSEIDKKISMAAWQVCRFSLLELAKKIREAIDSVDSSVHCMMCGSPYDIAYDGEIAKILAGKNNPSTLRIGNSRYNRPSPRDLYFTARQLVVQKTIASADRVFAELDTYPRNRYFTGARTLHSAFVVSLLEGASGAKFWPSRFVDYEPKSVVEYKKIFSENRGLYETLFRVVKDIKYSGLSEVVVPEFKTLRKDSDIFLDDKYYWGQIVGVMGLPFKYQEISKIDSPSFLRGDIAKRLSDHQLKNILSYGAIIDGSAALEIQERGLGYLLGVKVSPWNNNKKISRELLNKNCGSVSGRIMEAPSNPVKLEVNSPQTVIFSDFVNIPYTYGDKKLAKILSPACTFFENSEGGKVVVCASSPQGANYLNESKKALLVRLINKISPMNVWYDGDGECYFKTGVMPDGSHIAVLVNVGLDTLEGFDLGVSKSFTNIEYLDKNGIWNILADSKIVGDCVKIPLKAETFKPVVLRLR